MYALTPKVLRSNLDKNSKKYVLIGYGNTIMHYRLWDPDSRKTIIAINVVFNENGTTAASTLDPPHGEPLIEEEVQMLTEYRTNSSTGARETTQNIELMLEIDSEGHKHRNSKANNSTVTIPCSGADSGAIPKASM